MSYRKEFPSYPESPELAELIAMGFRDESWHNDACPQFISRDWRLRVYADFPDMDDREMGGPRFGLSLGDFDPDGDGDPSDAYGLIESDNFREIREAIRAQYAPPAAYMLTPIRDAAGADSFTRALHADGKLFHYDDSAENIVTGATGVPSFTAAEIEALNLRTTELQALPNYDPFELPVMLTHADGIQSDFADHMNRPGADFAALFATEDFAEHPEAVREAMGRVLVVYHEAHGLPPLDPADALLDPALPQEHYDWLSRYMDASEIAPTPAPVAPAPADPLEAIRAAASTIEAAPAGAAFSDDEIFEALQVLHGSAAAIVAMVEELRTLRAQTGNRHA